MESSELITDTFVDWIEIFLRRSFRSFLLFAKQNGFSLSQIAALFLIDRNESYSISDIGGELEITNPAASQLLDRLVQQGLVVRSEDPNDRRLKQVTLSEQGKDLLEQGLQARQKWLQDLIDLISPEEQGQVIESLKILLEKVQQLEYQPSCTAATQQAAS